MAVSKMRTINEVLKEIKEIDPKSAITYNLLRKLCEEGKIKHVMTGNKALINYDDFLEFLSRDAQ